ncbi:MAG: hypothetical protein PHW82_12475 [Bacteroidales bacterium]|nr:hypothetical protein [Bacteroidales bacterium]
MEGVSKMLNNDWKVRAIDRRLENKALKKRIKELTISRDGWRKRAVDSKNENVVLLAKLKSVKKKINQITEI